MSEVGTKYYLGTHEIGTTYLGDKLIVFNSFTAAEGGFDPDAQAFLTATGITDPTISDAINTLVLDLKADSIWTKLLALWPFVGGTATTNKYNLKDPRDLDAAYRLNFVGTWTHAANGSTPNGASGTYANTFLSPTTSPLTATNGMMYYYCPANYAGAQTIEIGSGDYNSGGESTIATKWTDNYIYFIWYNSASTPGYYSSLQTNSQAHWMVNKVSTGVQGWKNGVKLATSATNGTSSQNQPLYLGAENTGGSDVRNSVRRHTTTAVGEGLTDAQGLALYNAVNTFNTSLSR